MQLLLQHFEGFYTSQDKWAVAFGVVRHYRLGHVVVVAAVTAKAKARNFALHIHADVAVGVNANKLTDQAAKGFLCKGLVAFWEIAAVDCFG